MGSLPIPLTRVLKTHVLNETKMTPNVLIEKGHHACICIVSLDTFSREKENQPKGSLEFKEISEANEILKYSFHLTFGSFTGFQLEINTSLLLDRMPIRFLRWSRLCSPREQLTFDIVF